MKKLAVVASSIFGKVVLSVAVVVALGAVAKAETPEQINNQLKVENEKAINKLVEDVPTDKELIGNVKLTKHSKNPYGKHLIVEPFSCDVALADRKEMRRQLSNAKGLSQTRRNEYSSTLTTVTSLIREHKCGAK